MKGHGRTGRPWRRLREHVLREEPYRMIRGPKCKGISTTVDHIVALSVAPELAHERSSLRGACGACNLPGGSRITNGRRTAPAPMTRPVSPAHGQALPPAQLTATGAPST